MSNQPIIRQAVRGDATFLADITSRSARSHQERGIWDLVLPDSEEEVRRATAQIATFVENQDAIRAYKKVGFSVAEERTDVAFQGVIGSRGMAVMKLDLEAL